MKTAALATCLSLALASFVFAGCSSGDAAIGDDNGASTEGLSNAGGKPDPVSPGKPDPVSPGKPTPVSPGKPDPVSPGKPVASTSAAKCPPHERLCTLTHPNGTCYEGCVPDGVVCAAHTCPKPSPTPTPICDPAGPRPNPACSWDLKACEWSCPVCDPAGPAPLPGCKWDTKACEWLCL